MTEQLPNNDQNIQNSFNLHKVDLENLKQEKPKIDYKSLFINLGSAFVGSLLLVFIFNIATLNQSVFATNVPKASVFSPDVKLTTEEVKFVENGPSFVNGLEVINQKSTLVANTFPTPSNIVKLTIDPNKYKSFSGEEFKNFYNSFQYSFVSPLLGKPTIRAKPEADTVIQQIAEKRGYQLRSEATETRLSAVDGQRLQPEAKEAWLKLKSTAKNEGINLVLVSGYRSIIDQRGIFNGALGTSFNDDQISQGVANGLVNTILESISIPGYSRHHTGYTVDIGCDSSANFTKFRDTKCYTWISASNYVNAKRFGFIPSYPVGAPNQGPNPESWEYVWVGESELLKN